MPEQLVFSQLHLPRPFDFDLVTRFIVRLASTDLAHPIVFELRAGDEGVQHLVGSPVSSVHQVKRTLRAVFEHIQFTKAIRTGVCVAAVVSSLTADLPLNTGQPEALAARIYEALSTRRVGESMVLQLVVGQAVPGQFLDRDVADPFQTFGDRLLRGVRPASTGAKQAISAHVSEKRHEVLVRIGATASTPFRRERLMRGLFGAIQQIENAGMRFQLSLTAAHHLNRADTARRRLLRITSAELSSLVAWPTGESNYIGIDSVHPRRIPVPESVESKESLFALGTTPGPERHVGLDPIARLSHLGVLAPTGSGKSEAVLAPLLLSDVQAGRPVVLVDPKSQLVEFVLDALHADKSDRVVLFDPSDPTGTATFNPLDIGDRDPHIVVDSIMAVFKEVFSDGWGARTEDLLHSSLLTLAASGQQRETPHTLLDLPKLLGDAAFRRSVIGAVSNDPVLASFWARFDEMKPGQRENMIAAPLNKLRRFTLRRNVAGVIGTPHPEFRLRDVFRSDKIVLVALNEALVGPIAARLIGGLICAEVFLAAQERAAEKRPKDRPGMVFVDEVASFLHLPLPLETALEVSRSYGVGWHLFGQGRYQLTPSLAQAFEINTRSKITFETSPNEAREMAKHMPELTAEDIQALPRYEIYANLLTPTGSSGWFSARTLTPPQRLGHGETIRAEARRRNQEAALRRAPQPEQVPLEEAETVGIVRRRSRQGEVS